MKYDPIVSVLRHRREQLKISQKDLAAITGIGYRTIQRMESGDTDMKLRQYRKILEALRLTDMDVSVALFGHEMTKADDVASVSRLLPMHVRRMLVQFLVSISTEIKKSP
ncbi:helix-turn-helix domain-containing protein [Enterovibrio norvegicus]|uniref:helix-turn-helix domain-containing protein n=1 Tax=Enterovibrio norvegicus TaxID=188144 RepID=UPI00354DDC7E